MPAAAYGTLSEVALALKAGKAVVRPDGPAPLAPGSLP